MHAVDAVDVDVGERLAHHRGLVAAHDGVRGGVGRVSLGLDDPAFALADLEDDADQIVGDFERVSGEEFMI